MTDISPNDLNYGHFGATTYSLEDGEWAFSRNLDSIQLRQLGNWRTAFSLAVRFPTPKLTRPARDVQQATKSLIHDFPLLASVAGELPGLEAVSAAVQSATNTYDATVGDLFSFGSTAPDNKWYRHSRRVVAVPTGEAGNILRLHTLAKAQHGWRYGSESDKTVWIEGPSLMSGDSGYWNKEAAPIRQVCFSQSEDRRSFLAVRLPCRTVLFHPTYVHGGRCKPADPSEYYELPPSSVDAHPIGDITIEETGGTSHAHVTFNPEYQLQVGIVDQNGNWSIWEIDDGHLHNRGAYSIKCHTLGTLAAVVEESVDSPAYYATSKEDGWARILWVADVNTVVVCNRRQIRVFDIRQGSTLLKCPVLVSELSADWILDLKRHPKNINQFFVLTSSRLFLLAATSQSDAAGISSVEGGAAIVLSWVHFRGTEDITLQLCVSMISDDETVVMIHSRVNSLITVYRFEDNSSGTLPSSSSEPTTLYLDDVGSPSDSRRIVQLCLEPCQLRERERGHGLGPGRSYIDHGVKFYQLSALLSDLSLLQVTLYSLPPRAERQSGTRLEVQPTDWTVVVHHRRDRAFDDEILDDDLDDFFVDDALVETGGPRLKSPFKTAKPIKGRSVGDAPIKDYTSLYTSLSSTEPPTNTGDNTMPDTADISFVMEEAKKLLNPEPALMELPLGTLLEFAGLKIAISDIDEASSQLQELRSAEGHQEAVGLQRIASRRVLSLPGSDLQEQPTVSTLYDAILQNWIAPLPADIPVRVRQSKERLARRIAAEVMLAGTRIRRSEPPQAQGSIQPHPSQDSGVSLPVLPSSQLPNSSGPSSQPPSPSSTVPTPTASSTPAFALASDPLSRLSKHLRIERSPSTPISASVNQVLMHWQPGTDPGTYDWEATEEILYEALPIDDEESTQEKQEKREKARRKRERQERRQKRENELFREKAVVGSQPPVLRSSPGLMMAASSSQIPSQSQSQGFGGLGGLVVQSQIEPGKHGARPAKKKKVKSRMSGF